MNVFFGDNFTVDPFLIRSPDDLVVDVREVSDIGDLEISVAEIAADHIEDNGGSGVPDVAEVIDRDATDIQANPVFMERGEIFFFCGQRVVDAESHHSSLNDEP